MTQSIFSGDFMVKELENLTGTVEEITYFNEENGYTVMDISSNGDAITVVGNFPQLFEGEEVKLLGEWVNHSTYGTQFKASLVEQTLPADAAGILRYLASGIIKGVRESTAVKIVEAFGTDAFEVIENDVDRLSSVKGISKRFKLLFLAADKRGQPVGSECKLDGNSENDGGCKQKYL